MKSKFDIWFRKQFGHHPNDYRQTHEIELELKNAKANFERLQKEWNDKCRCADQYNAALYSKQAKDIKLGTKR